jgi:hypothetical protein
MFCPKCGKENSENANFCANCGQPLRVGSPVLDKHSLKEAKRQEKLQEKAAKEAKQDQFACEQAAADLSKELKGLISLPIDYQHNLIAAELDLWRFSTIDGRQFIIRAEGPPSRPALRTGLRVFSVGTVIEGTIPSTHVLKDCGKGRAFLPVPILFAGVPGFDAKKAYKEKNGWSAATLRLNTDAQLGSLLKKLSSGRESWSGRSYTYIPDDKKNPLTGIGQLVPQGDVTLAVLLFMGPAKGEVVKCINAMGRIRAIIGALAKPGFTYGPAIGWGIIHDLRGDTESAPRTHVRLREGWPLLTRAHAIQAQVRR